MDKIVEIAKANGAKSFEFSKNIHMTHGQLRATVEQVCATLVEALQQLIPTCRFCGEPATMHFDDYDGDEYLCDEHEKDHFYAYRGGLSEYDNIATNALAAHAALFGDKHE